MHTERARLPAVDKRMNIHDIDSNSSQLYPQRETIKKRAAAVACLIPSQWLVRERDYYTFHPETPTLTQRMKSFGELSQSEKFANEPAPGMGTAFLVEGPKGKRNVLLTAAYCVGNPFAPLILSKEELDQIRVVFRYHKTSARQKKFIFEEKDVYRIKKIVHNNYSCARTYDYESRSRGYALIKIDRLVKDIEPIPLSFSANTNEFVYALGCPDGTAVKCTGAFGARINQIACPSDSDSSLMHVVNLNILGNNIGSPILDWETGKAVGIVVEGNSRRYQQRTNPDTKKRELVSVYAQPTDAHCEDIGEVIEPNMVDPYSFSAKLGREKRKELSNKYSNAFATAMEEEYFPQDAMKRAIRTQKCATNWIITGSVLLPLAPIALPLAVKKKKRAEGDLKVWRENQRIFQETCRMGGDKANAVESHTIADLREAGYDTSTEVLGRIARIMCAYSIDSNKAARIDDIEHLFERRFSPEKIMDYLDFIGYDYDERFTKKILKRMHLNNPRNDFQQKTPAQRKEAVKQAAVQEYVKWFQEDRRLKNYSLEELKAISERMIERPEGAFEAACEALGFPDKVLDPREEAEAAPVNPPNPEPDRAEPAKVINKQSLVEDLGVAVSEKIREVQLTIAAGIIKTLWGI